MKRVVELRKDWDKDEIWMKVKVEGEGKKWNKGSS